MLFQACSRHYSVLTPAATPAAAAILLPRAAKTKVLEARKTKHVPVLSSRGVVVEADIANVISDWTGQGARGDRGEQCSGSESAECLNARAIQFTGAILAKCLDNRVMKGASGMVDADMALPLPSGM